MAVSVSKNSPFPSVLPPGMELMAKTGQKLKTAKASLKKAEARADSHRKFMRTARFTPEGYKKALAQQKKLDATVAKWQTEVKNLTRLLTSIG